MKDFADGRLANSKVGIEMINLESTARPRNQNSVVITSLPATLMYRKSRKRERTCTLYATTTTIKRLKLETRIFDVHLSQFLGSSKSNNSNQTTPPLPKLAENILFHSSTEIR